MNQLISVGDVPTVIAMIDCLRELNAADVFEPPDDAIPLLSATIDGATGNYTRGSTAACPRVAAVWNEKRSLLICHGTDHWTQNPGQISSYVVAPLESTVVDLVEPYSRYHKSAILLHFNHLLTLGFFSSPEVWVVGHSLGSGIALGTLGAWLDIAPPGLDQKTYAVTFGGNAYAGPGEASKFIHSDVRRYMNDDDPVSQLPWLIADLIPSAAIISPYNIRRVNNFTHPTQGVVIERDGTQTFADRPDKPLLNKAISLAQFLEAFWSQSNTPHETSEYRRRILLSAPAAPGSVAIMPRGLPTFADDPLVRPVPIGLSTAQQLANSYATLAVQNNPEVIRNTGERFEKLRWKARKVNGQWFVMRGEELGGISKGKRSAKRRAKAMNKVQATA